MVSCLVQNDKGQLLLIRHYKRGWEIPQGRVEEAESILEALHREIREETGIEMTPGPLVAVWSKLSPPSAVILSFLGNYTGGDLLPSEESPEIGWFDADEALALISHPVNRDRLKALIQFSGKMVFRSYTSNPYQVLTD